MSNFRDRMKKKRKAFKKRTQRPEESGGRFPTIFDKKKIPDGVGFYKCSEGEHIVDVIPFEVGSQMPHDDAGQPVSEEGEIDYIVDLYVHQNVGSMKQPYVCPFENFGLPCPICEYIKANRLEKEEWSQTSAKRRAIYLLWGRNDRKSEKLGIQIFDSSHFFMQEKIAEVAKLPRGGGNVIFSHPDKGKHVAWTRKGSGKENTSYLGHRLLDRESTIPDKILNAGFPLDECIKMHPTYEEIEKAFYGKKKKKDEGKKKKKKKSKYKINEVPEDEVKKKKKKKKKKMDEAPLKKKKKKKKSKAEEEPKKKKKKKKSKDGATSKKKKKRKLDEDDIPF